MANTTRKKRRRSPFVRTILHLFFILLLLSMLAAYISNQVSISSRRAELQTLNEQIEQQKTQNEEMKRILSGDADDVTEWVARDSYNYAAQRAHLCGCDRQLRAHPAGQLCGQTRCPHKKRARSIEFWQLR